MVKILTENGNERNCSKLYLKRATFKHVTRKISDATYAFNLSLVILSWSYNLIQTLMVGTDMAAY